MNVRLERDRAMRHAYNFARMRNEVWAQLWINRAGDFYPVTPRQLARCQSLLDDARREQRTS